MAVYNKPTIEDWTLARDLGGAEGAVLEETNMFQTDSRDLAADREAEGHADVLQTYGESSVSSADPLFMENEKLEKCRVEALSRYPSSPHAGCTNDSTKRTERLADPCGERDGSTLFAL